MKHALWQATIALVALVIAVRVIACLLPPLMPYVAVIFVMALILRLVWHHTR